MYEGYLGRFSTKETWSQAVQVTDENGNDADISSATIELDVRRFGASEDEAHALTASVGDGITVVSPLFTWTFTPTQMDTLEPDRYKVSVKVTISSVTTQLILGDLEVVDGI
jgi:hypothetical protein